MTAVTSAATAADTTAATAPGVPLPAPLSGRDAYRDELAALAADRTDLVCLEADLGGKKHPFQIAHPDRFFNVGIAEGAMVDMAAGLAAGGYKPFVSTFAPFAALRAAESLKLTLGYLNAGVTVVAPYAGVSGAWFGTTHHCLEDLAVLRSVPGVTIAAPYGEAEMRAVVRSAVRDGGPHYIRTGRNATYESLDLPGGELPLVNWEFSAADTDDVCLVSVGEEGTRLALAARAATGASHAHLVYLDHEHLSAAAAELAGRHTRFVVVEEHRSQGEWPRRSRCCCPAARSPRWAPVRAGPRPVATTRRSWRRSASICPPYWRPWTERGTPPASALTERPPGPRGPFPLLPPGPRVPPLSLSPSPSLLHFRNIRSVTCTS
ncbi:hypothetical protein ACOBQB_28880 [Streptomyces sp. G5(2025)]|uniref:hypothetical protein n=1 Tax=Streptomyces sp. G5(2025) TaxID=3406628 RepID=UPI003C19ACA2